VSLTEGYHVGWVAVGLVVVALVVALTVLQPERHIVDDPDVEPEPEPALQ